MSSVIPRQVDGLGSGLEFEALIADLSFRFVRLPAGEVDREIEDALRRVCESLDIDLAVLWQWPEPGSTLLIPTHAYCAEAGLRPSQPMREEEYPWSVQQVLAGRTFAISSPEDLPREAAVDRETCHRYGIKSAACLSLSVGTDQPVGALGLNALRTPRDWPDMLLQRLGLVAQVIANALARRRHELSLKESGDRLSLAADAAEAGLWTLDLPSGALWLTERARTILGFPAHETVDFERLEASVHPDDRALVRESVEQSARTGTAFTIEARLVVPDERRARWLAVAGRPHSQTPGEAGKLMGAVVDVTARKRVEAALRKSEARLAAGAELAGLAFYEVNFERSVAFIDERFREICGIPQDQSDGLGPLEFWMKHVHPEDLPPVLARREELHSGRTERITVEYRYLHPTQGEKWLHHVARVTRRDAAGRTVTTFGVLRDITERRRREEDLRASNAEITRLRDQLQAEADYLRAEIGVIRPGVVVTGVSPAIQSVLRLVERVAPTDSSVLIHGETGTGKELVAQALHRQSSRKGRHMVSLNCAALPAGLVESELFGRERGAFTGALTRQIGRFELADNSTLFLDEIGELSLEVQAKLLRVLESGEFERLGNSRTMKADVRVIAATNRDLLDDVRKKRFREDLYYRLNVFPIRVPPLRERTEDIPLLVWTFLEEFSSRMGKKITQVSRKTMDVLQNYRWPGNVRELRNVIEHAAILADGDTLRVGVLGSATVVDAPPAKLIDSERELILRALESAGWHIKGPKGAARALGLNPSTLYSRMKKLGLQLHPPGAAPSA